MQYIRVTFVVLPLIALAGLVSCTDSGDAEGGIKRNDVVFYSAAAPGPWIEQAVDHEPEITITRVDDRKVLNVSVPFTRNKEKTISWKPSSYLTRKGMS